MKAFFGLMILIGIIMAWNRNDDVFYEDMLAGQRGVGCILVLIGVIGLICLWLSP